MAVLILDPRWEYKVRSERELESPTNRDEVWDGVLVVPPPPNDEHQDLVFQFSMVFGDVVARQGLGLVRPGVNLSDREEGWTQNYREPDVVVYLTGNPAKNCGTHWVGGPDLLVEVASEGEQPRQKLDFYAKVSTREVLIVGRNPWGVEMYQLDTGTLQLAGRSDLSNPAALASGVLPLTFQLCDGSPRPTILVTHTATGQTWVV